MVFVIHTTLYLTFATAGRVRDRTASGSGIYMGFKGVKSAQKKREDHPRRCLQQNPEYETPIFI